MTTQLALPGLATIEHSTSASTHRWVLIGTAVIMLTMCIGLATLLAGGWWICGGWYFPVALLAIEWLCLSLAVLAGWSVYCRKQVPFRALLVAPIYAAAKLPIYIGFFLKRQTAWIRTERDARQAHSQ